ncbi:MAG: hypothetical protein JWN14_3034 [Chthonomonadales bacterium]|nr:hypothetical protein [Chthonomonadales bacterium]
MSPNCATPSIQAGGSTPLPNASLTQQAARPSTEPTPRLEFIDGLRALAMLMVLLFHTWAFSGGWHLDIPLGHHKFNLFSVFSIGHIGVSLFLVLSGFCLYWPFVKGGKRREMSLKDFAVKRCRRILPPYYIALLLFVLVDIFQIAQGSSQTSWAQLASSSGWHLLMLHNMRPEYFFDIDGSFWSLALESHLYIIFPLLVVVARRFGVRPMLLAALVASTIFRLLAVKTGAPQGDEQVNVLLYSVFARFQEFALGMFAASIVAHPKGIRALTRLDYVAGVAVLALSLASHKFGLMEVGKATLSGIVFMAILLAASRPGTLLHRLLTCQPMVRLGVMSYSIYLIHHPVVMTVGNWAKEHLHSDMARAFFELGLVIPSVLGIGFLFHILFEKPFMKPPTARPQATPPLAAHGLLAHPTPLPSETQP